MTLDPCRISGPVRKVSSRDLGRNVAELLNEVERDGNSVLIIRYGRPSALLCPVGDEVAVQASRLAQQLGWLHHCPVGGADSSGLGVGAERTDRLASIVIRLVDSLSFAAHREAVIEARPGRQRPSPRRVQ